MAPKRRNMFYENKKQATTEIGVNLEKVKKPKPVRANELRARDDLNTRITDRAIELKVEMLRLLTKDKSKKDDKLSAKQDGADDSRATTQKELESMDVAKETQGVEEDNDGLDTEAQVVCPGMEEEPSRLAEEYPASQLDQDLAFDSIQHMKRYPGEKASGKKLLKRLGAGRRGRKSEKSDPNLHPDERRIFENVSQRQDALEKEIFKALTKDKSMKVVITELPEVENGKNGLDILRDVDSHAMVMIPRMRKETSCLAEAEMSETLTTRQSILTWTHIGIVKVRWKLRKTDFTVQKFLEDCRKDYIPTIMSGAVAGNMDVIRDWCAEPAFTQFSNFIEMHKKKERDFCSRLVRVRRVTLAGGTVTPAGPVLHIRFETLQTFCIRDGKGKIVDGHPEHLLLVDNWWTMIRDPGEQDPRAAWRLLKLFARDQNSIVTITANGQGVQWGGSLTPLLDEEGSTLSAPGLVLLGTAAFYLCKYMSMYIPPNIVQDDHNTIATIAAEVSPAPSWWYRHAECRRGSLTPLLDEKGSSLSAPGLVFLGTAALYLCKYMSMYIAPNIVQDDHNTIATFAAEVSPAPPWWYRHAECRRGSLTPLLDEKGSSLSAPGLVLLGTAAFYLCKYMSMYIAPNIVQDDHNTIATFAAEVSPAPSWWYRHAECRRGSLTPLLDEKGSSLSAPGLVLLGTAALYLCKRMSMYIAPNIVQDDHNTIATIAAEVSPAPSWWYRHAECRRGSLTPLLDEKGSSLSAPGLVFLGTAALYLCKRMSMYIAPNIVQDDHNTIATIAAEVSPAPSWWYRHAECRRGSLTPLLDEKGSSLSAPGLVLLGTAALYLCKRMSMYIAPNIVQDDHNTIATIAAEVSPAPSWWYRHAECRRGSLTPLLDEKGSSLSAPGLVLLGTAALYLCKCMSMYIPPNIVQDDHNTIATIAAEVSPAPSWWYRHAECRRGSLTPLLDEKGSSLSAPGLVLLGTAALYLCKRMSMYIAPNIVQDDHNTIATIAAEVSPAPPWWYRHAECRRGSLTPLLDEKGSSLSAPGLVLLGTAALYLCKYMSMYIAPNIVQDDHNTIATIAAEVSPAPSWWYRHAECRRGSLTPLLDEKGSSLSAPGLVLLGTAAFYLCKYMSMYIAPNIVQDDHNTIATFAAEVSPAPSWWYRHAECRRGSLTPLLDEKGSSLSAPGLVLLGTAAFYLCKRMSMYIAPNIVQDDHNTIATIAAEVSPAPSWWYRHAECRRGSLTPLLDEKGSSLSAPGLVLLGTAALYLCKRMSMYIAPNIVQDDHNTIATIAAEVSPAPSWWYRHAECRRGSLTPLLDEKGSSLSAPGLVLLGTAALYLCKRMSMYIAPNIVQDDHNTIATIAAEVSPAPPWWYRHAECRRGSLTPLLDEKGSSLSAPGLVLLGTAALYLCKYMSMYIAPNIVQDDHNTIATIAAEVSPAPSWWYRHAECRRGSLTPLLDEKGSSLSAPGLVLLGTAAFYLCKYMSMYIAPNIVQDDHNTIATLAAEVSPAPSWWYRHAECRRGSLTPLLDEKGSSLSAPGLVFLGTAALYLCKRMSMYIAPNIVQDDHNTIATIAAEVSPAPSWWYRHAECRRGSLTPLLDEKGSSLSAPGLVLLGTAAFYLCKYMSMYIAPNIVQDDHNTIATFAAEVSPAPSWWYRHAECRRGSLTPLLDEKGSSLSAPGLVLLGTAAFYLCKYMSMYIAPNIVQDDHNTIATFAAEVSPAPSWWYRHAECRRGSLTPLLDEKGSSLSAPGLVLLGTAAFYLCKRMSMYIAPNIVQDDHNTIATIAAEVSPAPSWWYRHAECRRGSLTPLLDEKGSSLSAPGLVLLGTAALYLCKRMSMYIAPNIVQDDHNTIATIAAEVSPAPSWWYRHAECRRGSLTPLLDEKGSSLSAPGLVLLGTAALYLCKRMSMYIAPNIVQDDHNTIATFAAEVSPAPSWWYRHAECRRGSLTPLLDEKGSSLSAPGLVLLGTAAFYLCKYMSMYIAPNIVQDDHNTIATFAAEVSPAPSWWYRHAECRRGSLTPLLDEKGSSLSAPGLVLLGTAALYLCKRMSMYIAPNIVQDDHNTIATFAAEVSPAPSWWYRHAECRRGSLTPLLDEKGSSLSAPGLVLLGTSAFYLCKYMSMYIAPNIVQDDHNTIATFAAEVSPAPSWWYRHAECRRGSLTPLLDEKGSSLSAPGLVLLGTAAFYLCKYMSMYIAPNIVQDDHNTIATFAAEVSPTPPWWYRHAECRRGSLTPLLDEKGSSLSAPGLVLLGTAAFYLCKYMSMYIAPNIVQDDHNTIATFAAEVSPAPSWWYRHAECRRGSLTPLLDEKGSSLSAPGLVLLGTAAFYLCKRMSMYIAPNIVQDDHNTIATIAAEVSPAPSWWYRHAECRRGSLTPLLDEKGSSLSAPGLVLLGTAALYLCKRMSMYIAPNIVQDDHNTIATFAAEVSPAPSWWYRPAECRRGSLTPLLDEKGSSLSAPGLVLLGTAALYLCKRMSMYIAPNIVQDDHNTIATFAAEVSPAPSWWYRHAECRRGSLTPLLDEKGSSLSAPGLVLLGTAALYLCKCMSMYIPPNIVQDDHNTIATIAAEVSPAPSWWYRHAECRRGSLTPLLDEKGSSLSAPGLVFLGTAALYLCKRMSMYIAPNIVQDDHNTIATIAAEVSPAPSWWYRHAECRRGSLTPLLDEKGSSLSAPGLVLLGTAAFYLCKYMSMYIAPNIVQDDHNTIATFAAEVSPAPSWWYRHAECRRGSLTPLLDEKGSSLSAPGLVLLGTAAFYLCKRMSMYIAPNIVQDDHNTIATFAAEVSPAPSWWYRPAECRRGSLTPLLDEKGSSLSAPGLVLLGTAALYLCKRMSMYIAPNIVQDDHNTIATFAAEVSPAPSWWYRHAECRRGSLTPLLDEKGSSLSAPGLVLLGTAALYLCKCMSMYIPPNIVQDDHNTIATIAAEVSPAPSWWYRHAECRRGSLTPLLDEKGSSLSAPGLVFLGTAALYLCKRMSMYIAPNIVQDDHNTIATIAAEVSPAPSWWYRHAECRRGSLTPLLDEKGSSLSAPGLVLLGTAAFYLCKYMSMYIAPNIVQDDHNTIATFAAEVSPAPSWWYRHAECRRGSLTPLLDEKGSSLSAPGLVLLGTAAFYLCKRMSMYIAPNIVQDDHNTIATIAAEVSPAPSWWYRHAECRRGSLTPLLDEKGSSLSAPGLVLLGTAALYLCKRMSMYIAPNIVQDDHNTIATIAAEVSPAPSWWYRHAECRRGSLTPLLDEKGSSLSAPGLVLLGTAALYLCKRMSMYIAPNIVQDDHNTIATFAAEVSPAPSWWYRHAECRRGSLTPLLDEKGSSLSAPGLVLLGTAAFYLCKYMSMYIAPNIVQDDHNTIATFAAEVSPAPSWWYRHAECRRGSLTPLLDEKGSSLSAPGLVLLGTAAFYLCKYMSMYIAPNIVQDDHNTIATFAAEVSPAPSWWYRHAECRRGSLTPLLDEKGSSLSAPGLVLLGTAAFYLCKYMSMYIAPNIVQDDHNTIATFAAEVSPAPPWWYRHAECRRGSLTPLLDEKGSSLSAPGLVLLGTAAFYLCKYMSMYIAPNIVQDDHNTIATFAAEVSPAPSWWYRHAECRRGSLTPLLDEKGSSLSAPGLVLLGTAAFYLYKRMSMYIAPNIVQDDHNTIATIAAEVSPAPSWWYRHAECRRGSLTPLLDEKGSSLSAPGLVLLGTAAFYLCKRMSMYIAPNIVQDDHNTIATFAAEVSPAPPWWYRHAECRRGSLTPLLDEKGSSLSAPGLVLLGTAAFYLCKRMSMYIAPNIVQDDHNTNATIAAEVSPAPSWWYRHAECRRGSLTPLLDEKGSSLSAPGLVLLGTAALYLCKRMSMYIAPNIVQDDHNTIATFAAEVSPAPPWWYRHAECRRGSLTPLLDEKGSSLSAPGLVLLGTAAFYLCKYMSMYIAPNIVQDDHNTIATFAAEVSPAPSWWYRHAECRRGSLTPLLDEKGSSLSAPGLVLLGTAALYLCKCMSMYIAPNIVQDDHNTIATIAAEVSPAPSWWYRHAECRRGSLTPLLDEKGSSLSAPGLVLLGTAAFYLCKRMSMYFAPNIVQDDHNTIATFAAEVSPAPPWWYRHAECRRGSLTPLLDEKGSSLSAPGLVLLGTAAFYLCKRMSMYIAPNIVQDDHNTIATIAAEVSPAPSWWYRHAECRRGSLTPLLDEKGSSLSAPGLVLLGTAALYLCKRMSMYIAPNIVQDDHNPIATFAAEVSPAPPWWYRHAECRRGSLTPLLDEKGSSLSAPGLVLLGTAAFYLCKRMSMYIAPNIVQDDHNTIATIAAEVSPAPSWWYRHAECRRGSLTPLLDEKGSSLSAPGLVLLGTAAFYLCKYMSMYIAPNIVQDDHNTIATFAAEVSPAPSWWYRHAECRRGSLTPLLDEKGSSLSAPGLVLLGTAAFYLCKCMSMYIPPNIVQDDHNTIAIFAAEVSPAPSWWYRHAECRRGSLTPLLDEKGSSLSAPGLVLLGTAAFYLCKRMSMYIPPNIVQDDHNTIATIAAEVSPAPSWWYRHAECRRGSLTPLLDEKGSSLSAPGLVLLGTAAFYLCKRMSMYIAPNIVQDDHNTIATIGAEVSPAPSWWYRHAECRRGSLTPLLDEKGSSLSAPGLVLLGTAAFYLCKYMSMYIAPNIVQDDHNTIATIAAEVSPAPSWWYRHAECRRGSLTPLLDEKGSSLSAPGLVLLGTAALYLCKRMSMYIAPNIVQDDHNTIATIAAEVSPAPSWWYRHAECRRGSLTPLLDEKGSSLSAPGLVLLGTAALHLCKRMSMYIAPNIVQDDHNTIATFAAEVSPAPSWWYRHAECRRGSLTPLLDEKGSSLSAPGLVLLGTAAFYLCKRMSMYIAPNIVQDDHNTIATIAAEVSPAPSWWYRHAECRRGSLTPLLDEKGSSLSAPGLVLLGTAAFYLCKRMSMYIAPNIVQDDHNTIATIAAEVSPAPSWWYRHAECRRGSLTPLLDEKGSSLSAPGLVLLGTAAFYLCKYMSMYIAPNIVQDDHNTIATFAAEVSPAPSWWYRHAECRRGSLTPLLDEKGSSLSAPGLVLLGTAAFYLCKCMSMYIPPNIVQDDHNTIAIFAAEVSPAPPWWYRHAECRRGSLTPLLDEKGSSLSAPGLVLLGTAAFYLCKRMSMYIAPNIVQDDHNTIATFAAEVSPAPPWWYRHAECRRGSLTPLLDEKGSNDHNTIAIFAAEVSPAPPWWYRHAECRRGSLTPLLDEKGSSLSAPGLVLLGTAAFYLCKRMSMYIAPNIVQDDHNTTATIAAEVSPAPSWWYRHAECRRGSLTPLLDEKGSSLSAPGPVLLGTAALYLCKRMSMYIAPNIVQDDHNTIATFAAEVSPAPSWWYRHAECRRGSLTPLLDEKGSSLSAPGPVLLGTAALYLCKRMSMYIAPNIVQDDHNTIATIAAEVSPAPSWWYRHAECRRGSLTPLLDEKGSSLSAPGLVLLGTAALYLCKRMSMYIAPNIVQDDHNPIATFAAEVSPAPSWWYRHAECRRGSLTPLLDEKGSSLSAPGLVLLGTAAFYLCKYMSMYIAPNIVQDDHITIATIVAHCQRGVLCKTV
ncbi:hypothetical protein AAG570_013429 [Ranatra chinensis]|uniref:Tim44-like domain-containing protein n=1 Tax=Ranatra chinensis TaxID=642074 RepID=A0ABD0YC55_9HEMI